MKRGEKHSTARTGDRRQETGDRGQGTDQTWMMLCIARRINKLHRERIVSRYSGLSICDSVYSRQYKVAIRLD